MNPLFEPLTDAELDRIDADADTDGKDKGVLNISELDEYRSARGERGNKLPRGFQTVTGLGVEGG